MIKISDFKKYYGNFLALEIPEISFSEGIHWIKGKNGSGKTTLFKSLAGLLPFQGKLEIEGNPIDRKAKNLRLWVNYAEAEPKLPVFLSGLDFISLFQKVKGGSKNQTESLIEQFGAEDFVERPISAYSSGMLKKLYLILAFIGQPKVILLDEPFNALDKEANELLYKLLQQHAEEAKACILIAAHQDLNIDVIDIKNTYHIENQTIRHA